jgi:hypothetical protein
LFELRAQDGSYTLNFAPSPGMTLVRLTSTQGQSLAVLIAEYDAATRLWQPTIAGGGNYANYVGVSASTPLLVSGPYLVRNATLDSRQHLSLWGDVDQTTAISIFGPPALSSVQWNGALVKSLKQTGKGSWKATIPFTAPAVQLPDLASATWRFRDSLPEIQPDFDGFGTIPAVQTTTTSVFPPYYGEPWILYADQYGFHVCIFVFKKYAQPNQFPRRGIWCGVAPSCTIATLPRRPR